MITQHRKAYRWRSLMEIIFVLYMCTTVHLQTTSSLIGTGYSDDRPTVAPGTTGELAGFDSLLYQIFTGQARVLLNCASGRMLVNLTFYNDFGGLVYAEHRKDSECKFNGNGHDRFYSMVIPLRNCSTNQTSNREFRNEIVIHYETEQDLEIYADEVITLICRYSPPVDAALGPAIGILPPVAAAGPPPPLTFWEILLIICAILFLALLLLGLCCAYYCLKKRNVKIVRRRKAFSTAPGSVMTKLSGSTMGPLSLFDGIRIPRAAVMGGGSNASDNALLSREKSNIQYNEFQSAEIASDYPSESPSSRYSDVEDVDMVTEGWHRTLVTGEGAGAMALGALAISKGYENRGYEEEERSSLGRPDGLNIMDLNHSIPKVQTKGAFLPTIEEDNRNSSLMNELRSVTEEVRQRRAAPVSIDEWIPQNEIVPLKNIPQMERDHPDNESFGAESWKIEAPHTRSNIEETEEIITQKIIEERMIQDEYKPPPPPPPPQPKTEIREEIITEEFVDTTYTTHTRKYIPPVYSKIQKKKKNETQSISDDSSVRRMMIPNGEEIEVMRDIPETFSPEYQQESEFHTDMYRDVDEKQFTEHSIRIPPPPYEPPPPPPPPDFSTNATRETISHTNKISEEDIYENLSILNRQVSQPDLSATFRVISPISERDFTSPDVTAAFRVIPPEDPPITNSEEGYPPFENDSEINDVNIQENEEFEKWSELMASNTYHMFTSDVEKQNLDGYTMMTNPPDYNKPPKRPINWDVIFKILEPPATRYKSHGKIILTPEDVEKIKSLVRNDSQFRVMVESAVNMEDLYHIRYHEKYSKLFENHKWEIIIKIIANAVQVGEKQPDADGVSETRSISEAEFMNKSIIRETREQHPSSPTTTITSHADDRAISEAEFVNKSFIRDDLVFDSPSTTLSRDTHFSDSVSLKSSKFPMQESDITETYISYAKESGDGSQQRNQSQTEDVQKSSQKSLMSDHDSLESIQFLDNDINQAYLMLNEFKTISSPQSSDILWSDTSKDKQVKMKPSLERSSTEWFENVPTVLSPGIQKPTVIRPTLERSSTEIIMNPLIIQDIDHTDKEETKSIGEKQVHDWHKF